MYRYFSPAVAALCIIYLFMNTGVNHIQSTHAFVHTVRMGRLHT